MPISIQSIEERLSVSYVSAVVARAGFAYEVVPKDYGVDIGIRRIDTYRGGQVDMGVAVDCQLKATVNWSENANVIVFDMEVEAYNKLVYRRQNAACPCILVLYCLPKNNSEWLVVNERELRLQKCCYWTIVAGPESINKQSQRIHIPKENWFHPEAVARIVQQAVEGALS